MSLFNSDIEIPTTLLVEATLWVLVAAALL